MLPPTQHHSSQRKRSSNWRNLKTRALRFNYWRTENSLKTEMFERDNETMIMWLSCPSYPQTQLQNEQ